MKNKQDAYDGFVNATALNQTGLVCTGFTGLGWLVLMGDLLVSNSGLSQYAAVVILTVLGFAGGRAAVPSVLTWLRRKYVAASAAQFMYFAVMLVTIVGACSVVELATDGYLLAAILPLALGAANIGVYTGCEERKFAAPSTPRRNVTVPPPG